MDRTNTSAGRPPVVPSPVRFSDGMLSTRWVGGAHGRSVGAIVWGAELFR